MNNIHILGIGGIGASYVARYLHYTGFHVTGSDMTQNTTVMELLEEGIGISIGHHKDNISDQVDLVLISPAILSARPDEFEEVLRRNIPYMTWQQYLGDITKSKKTIAICGAHGKSTTTGMVTSMLLHAGLDPTVMIGTKMKELDNKNIRIGKSDLLVIEADEFHDNFLSYTPTYILCTSYEPDHLDYFKTEERYRDSFVQFFSRLQDTKGTLFTHNDEEVCAIAKQAGVTPSVASAITYELSVMGLHNRQNAALVHALGVELGIDADTAQKGIQAFHGTWRRMEYIGTFQGSEVYDDYAHHPTEVKATLEALHSGKQGKKIIALFQPHQYSRTLQCLPDFGTAFEDAMITCILDIYPSRDTEEDMKKVHAQDVVDAINKHNPHSALYIENQKSLKEFLEKNASTETVIIAMGAGSISDQIRSMLTSKEVS